ncbi:hypothetical protein [Pseudoalteromonas phenolica]|uniref:Uncharacterized protein n=1 Tax=Pseudoalteromonas phenolica TaxID=161398 RepID=A0A0S2K670_9GAMM|nr:hypothetical protein [Pseudoalteromonas phenolica]ALO43672.1 hypothetical protein PP2015_3194 [Pseudoalteromonas phenolica]MBE0355158.1 hypothetical protein [Pseudoalteromonas phenolica O-BC30]RXE94563.1 hypothetical protein D9981_18980 [Pseudoalteromonas phenolica O-BC30]
MTHSINNEEKVLPKKQSFELYFQDGDNQIACKANMFTGKEYVYINDELVSEKRNIGFKTVHEFEFEDKPWQVTFDVMNLITCRTECVVIKNKKIIGRKILDPFSWKALFKFFIYGVIFGVLFATLGYFLGGLYGSTL